MTSTASSITPHILALAIFLSLCWGVYLVDCARDLNRARGTRNTSANTLAAVVSFRRLIVAICVFMLPFSLVFRTTLVLLGSGDAFAGHIVFFALAGVNVPGAVFAALTVVKPGWFD